MDIGPFITALSAYFSFEPGTVDVLPLIAANDEVEAREEARALDAVNGILTNDLRLGGFLSLQRC